MWAIHWRFMGQEFLAFGWDQREMAVYFVEDGKAVERANMTAPECLLRMDGLAQVVRKLARWPIRDIEAFGVRTPLSPGAQARQALSGARSRPPAGSPEIRAATRQRSPRPASP